MERLPGIGQSNIEYKIENRGLFVDAGAGDVTGSDNAPGGATYELPPFSLEPIHRIDVGVKILDSDPSYEEIFRKGIARARDDFRDKVPVAFEIADLEDLEEERLSEYEDSSLKRGGFMGDWGEDLGIDEIPDDEMTFLNRSTVGNSVLYMQRKVLGVVLDEEEIVDLKARQPKLPAVPRGTVLTKEQLAELKRRQHIVADHSALILLQAMDAHLANQ